MQFRAKLGRIKDWVVMVLPQDASNQLSSRGMSLAAVTIGEYHFLAPLEPDGKGSHWFRIGPTVLNAIHAKLGKTVTVQLEPVQEWPRPELPEDIKRGVAKVPEAQALWGMITPKAQWEWVRWIRATNNTETRQRRIEVACSKMKSGERRPCCFNSNMCTEPYVSHNGRLLDPAETTK